MMVRTCEWDGCSGALAIWAFDNNVTQGATHVSGPERKRVCLLRMESFHSFIFRRAALANFALSGRFFLFVSGTSNQITQIEQPWVLNKTFSMVQFFVLVLFVMVKADVFEIFF